MKLNHVSSVKTPSIGIADGEGTKAVLKQLMRLIYDTFVDIYQDLLNISTTTVSSLPTASKDLLGGSRLVTQGSAADKLYVCVYNTNTSAYEWKEISYV